ncbi:19416_t:CDS:2 [Rhizophagus irregularis]|nr:19416_t:CDS:2 [Rhizophagus irregularis]
MALNNKITQLDDYRLEKDENRFKGAEDDINVLFKNEAYPNPGGFCCKTFGEEEPTAVANTKSQPTV